MQDPNGFQWEAGLVVAVLTPAYLVPAFLLHQRRGVPDARAGKMHAKMQAWVPICGSALLFAAFHAAIWVSLSPLLGLAVGVGWLAYRTGSLVGPITVHAVFNAIACLVLVFAQAEKEMKGNEETTAWRPSACGSIVKTVPGSWLPRLR